MKTRSWKRFGSCLMALAMVLSGTALPASAATPGKDGSAEMNEAYAAHESLMPIGPSFSVAPLSAWPLFWSGRRNLTRTHDTAGRAFPWQTERAVLS